MSLNTDSQRHHQRLSRPGRSVGHHQKPVKTEMVSLSKTRLGLDINQDGGHRALKKQKEPQDGEHQRKGGVEQKRVEKYGLEKSNQPELGNRGLSHGDLVLAASREVLGWVVPRDELDLINGALPLGCKALAPGGSLASTAFPRSRCLGGVVGGGVRVLHHHVVVLKHGSAAGADVGLREGLLVAQMHLLEGTCALMKTLRRQQALLRMQVFAGEEVLVRYDALSRNSVVVVRWAVASPSTATIGKDVFL